MKGELVEEFIYEHSLVVLNQPVNPATHRNLNGYETNIDVTLDPSGLSRKVNSWQVKDWSTSDSRPIEIVLNFDSENPLQRKRCFNTRLANWKKISKQLEVKRVRLDQETFGSKKSVKKFPGRVN